MNNESFILTLKSYDNKINRDDTTKDEYDLLLWELFPYDLTPSGKEKNKDKETKTINLIKQEE